MLTNSSSSLKVMGTTCATWANKKSQVTLFTKKKPAYQNDPWLSDSVLLQRWLYLNNNIISFSKKKNQIRYLARWNCLQMATNGTCDVKLLHNIFNVFCLRTGAFQYIPCTPVLINTYRFFCWTILSWKWLSSETANWSGSITFQYFGILDSRCRVDQV